MEFITNSLYYTLHIVHCTHCALYINSFKSKIRVSENSMFFEGDRSHRPMTFVQAMLTSPFKRDPVGRNPISFTFLDLLILNKLPNERPSPGLTPSGEDLNTEMEDIGATADLTCTSYH